MATVHEKSAQFDVIAVLLGLDPRKVPPEHVVAAVDHARVGAAVLRELREEIVVCEEAAKAEQWFADDDARGGK